MFDYFENPSSEEHEKNVSSKETSTTIRPLTGPHHNLSTRENKNVQIVHVKIEKEKHIPTTVGPNSTTNPTSSVPISVSAEPSTI